MYEYKTEILQVSKRGFVVASQKTLEEDVAVLDDLINAKAADGWELVTYLFTDVNLYAKATGILVTFRKQKS